MRTIAAVMYLLSLLATSCASPSARAPLPGEDGVARKEMLAHVTEVWSQVRETLGDPQQQFSIPADAARSCEMGIAKPVWDIDVDTLSATGSAWSSFVEDPRHRYYIAVTSDGRQVATLTTHKYDGKWRVWPHRDYARMATEACLKLDEYFGDDSYDWEYVESGGVWVIARSGGREAGVLIEPWGCGRDGVPPEGVLAGDDLNWCLMNPDGPYQPAS